MKKTYSLLILIIAAIPLTVAAGNNDSALKTKVTQWMSTGNGIRFLENKGQMMDMQRKPVPYVLYEASAGGMDVYVTTDGLSYVFTKMDKHKKAGTSTIPTTFLPHHENDSVTMNYCRADMELVGADIRKENIIKEDESTDKTDYYYGDICPDGILNVHSYGRVTIKNIYPGIDWVLHSGKQGLKYDFIVHPGADPSLIQLKYKWTDKPQLQPDGALKISIPMGNITEGTPVSYSADKQVQTTYSIENNEIHFKVNTYNTRETLIIDPTLVWATYYGGSCNEDVWSMQDDGSNVWITGEILSTIFPTLNPGGGAYFQGTSTSTNYTAYILKFNIAGVLKWATYYGGSAGDGGESIYSDGTSVWVTGWTDSTLPTYNPGGGAYFQATDSGLSDAFILQFSVNGVRKWATYYGGWGDEQIGNSIYSDGTDVWVCGNALSYDFPIFNPGGGAYFQHAPASLLLHGPMFILQFSTAGVRKWATYYGGNGDGDDIANSIQSNGANVWVTGSTSSTDFPTFNPGGGAYFQSTLGSASGNAFILQFDTAGVRKWATYYGGGSTTYGDIGNSIYSDGVSVWITGCTSSTDFPTLNPGGRTYYQGALTATIFNAFVLQFNIAGVRKWATYYGGSRWDVGYSIQSDGNNVWVCGAAGSKDFPLLNPGWGFFQDSLRNANITHQNVFILQFNTAGVRKWGTYYGSDWENDGSYIWSDGANLFVAGDATTSDYPILNPGGGAYFLDTVYGKGKENVFIGKFRIACLPNVTVSPLATICAGGSTILKASGALTYNWNPPGGLSGTHIPNPVASPTATTTYTLISDSTGCLDTNTVTVKVKQPPTVNACCDTSLMPGQSAHLSATGSGAYLWSPPTGLSCDTCANPVASPNETSTYTLTLTNDSGCIAQSFVTIDVHCGNIFVPTAFSPDMAINNILYVRCDCITSINFMVFDRWGNKVFESQNLNDGWDGTYKGQAMNTATYVWCLKATLQDGTSIERKGNVTLVR